jgi:hypothetical protein
VVNVEVTVFRTLHLLQVKRDPATVEGEHELVGQRCFRNAPTRQLVTLVLTHGCALSRRRAISAPARSKTAGGRPLTSSASRAPLVTDALAHRVEQGQHFALLPLEATIRRQMHDGTPVSLGLLDGVTSMASRACWSNVSSISRLG